MTDLPERFANMPFEEVMKILEDPAKHGVTFKEMMLLANWSSDILNNVQKATDGEKYWRNECNCLQKRYNKLREDYISLNTEYERVMKTLADLVGVNED